MYSNKSIARSFVGQWSISRRHSRIQMCNSAGLLLHVACSLLAQEMVTQQESSDSGAEACQRVREPHSGKFWLDVKKAQGWLNTATWWAFFLGESQILLNMVPDAASALTESGWPVQRSLPASIVLLSISEHKSNCSEERSEYLNTCFWFLMTLLTPQDVWQIQALKTH